MHDSVSSQPRPRHDRSHTSGSSHLPQSTTSHQPSLAQAGGAIVGDPSRLINGFGDSKAGNSKDVVMNMDPDNTLDQDHSMEDNAVQTSIWKQWDAWLADSNVMRPLISTEYLKG